MMNNNCKPIVVSGIPRSGSTWLGKTLAANSNVKYIHEPDNEKNNLFAYGAKRDLHRYPYLTNQDENVLYQELWELAFKGIDLNNKFLRRIMFLNYSFLEKKIGKKCNWIHDDFFRHTNFEKASTDSLINLKETFTKFFFKLHKGFNFSSYDQIIVKSVHNLLSLKWIQKKFDVNIVIIVRHPANVISSCLRLRLPDAVRNIFTHKKLVKDHFASYPDKIEKATNKIEMMALQVGAFYSFIEDHLDNDWILIKHEDLCRNLMEQFKALYEKLNLEWNEKVENFIYKNNKEGSKFEINRRARDQIYKYKDFLNERQVNKIKNYYDSFCNQLYNKEKW